MPAELEQTLATLVSHRSVLGYLVLTRSTEPVSIVRHVGVVFEGEQGKKYANAIKRIVDTCTTGLQEVGGGESDEVRFMRIRTHRHELLISPDSRYILVVLQNPAMT
ncbi:hypothetical protein M422DRAFT_244237 [Sphaerobolus stellatus SS14]|nr:hypothetical protein M422DRAFT_244237 [Sphaerobolus stellatus SS14]